MKYFILAFKQAFNFKGRANRPEFWYFTLFSTIISIICLLIDTQVLGTAMSETGLIGFIHLFPLYQAYLLQLEDYTT